MAPPLVPNAASQKLSAEVHATEAKERELERTLKEQHITNWPHLKKLTRNKEKQSFFIKIPSDAGGCSNFTRLHSLRVDYSVPYASNKALTFPIGYLLYHLKKCYAAMNKASLHRFDS